MEYNLTLTYKIEFIKEFFCYLNGNGIKNCNFPINSKKRYWNLDKIVSSLLFYQEKT